MIRSYALVLLAVSTATLANEIECPAGTAVNTEQSAGGESAWCELETDRSVLHGPYRAWYTNGVLGTEEDYVLGKASGHAVYHWGSGHKQAQGRYKAGMREGWWRFWDKTGTPAGRVRYRDGTVVAGRLPKWAADWPPTPAGQHPPAQP